jgi:hypothetical protein
MYMKRQGKQSWITAGCVLMLASGAILAAGIHDPAAAVHVSVSGRIAGSAEDAVDPVPPRTVSQAYTGSKGIPRAGNDVGMVPQGDGSYDVVNVSSRIIGEIVPLAEGGFEFIDNAGVLLGIWSWNGDQAAWVFSEYLAEETPAGGLTIAAADSVGEDAVAVPQTGGESGAGSFLLGLAVIVCGFVLFKPPIKPSLYK